jgi:hypothetical protein
MDTISVRGHEFKAFNIRDSSSRRALQYKNNIIFALRKLGVDEDDIDIPLETIVIKRSCASAAWYYNGRNMFFDYKSAGKFIENLYIISKVIEMEVAQVRDGSQSSDKFTFKFSEEDDIQEKRMAARHTLGVNEESDLEVINSKFKALAKEYHPDMPNGSTEKFKLINNAHKILKQELA